MIKIAVSFVIAFIIALSATYGFNFVAEYIFSRDDVRLGATILFGVFIGATHQPVVCFNP